MFLIMFNVERGGIAKTPKVEQKNKQTNKQKQKFSLSPNSITIGLEWLDFGIG